MTDEQLVEIMKKHDSPPFYSGTMSAMREAMRIESVGFGVWMNKNYQSFMATDRYMKQLTKEGMDKLDSWPALDTIETFTIDEIYNEYLKQNEG
jgi:hypothetical protein